MATINTVQGTFGNVTKSSKINKVQSQHINKQRSSITTATHRSSLLTQDGNSLCSASIGEMSNNGYKEGMLPDVHVLNRSNNEGTAPTMFSVVSHSDLSSNRSHLHREASRRTNSRLPFFSFLNSDRRRKQLSEDQLRKQIKKHCENRDWSKVRKLISNHDFTDVPEVVLETSSAAAKSSSSEGKLSQNMEPAQTSRRPSYGSRNGERLSFTGKESSAAADAMKVAAAMALLEEAEASSSSEDCSRKAEVVCDENVLHDVCRHHPPRDVIELLLVAMRHRRGSTCGRDEMGRTPLHVAVATGSSPGVIDALIRADPLPATMGDADKRAPLHLAVKYLAYEERYSQQNESTPVTQRSSKLSLFKFKKSSSACASHPILSREEELEETRQIVVILKNAMMTNPGQIDFKDEDGTGFSPLDYAIDGSIKDRTILRSLIRRDKPHEICRRSTHLSQSSDKTPKTRNTIIALTKQTSDKTLGSLNRRRRLSTQSGSSVSARNSFTSQDVDVVHQIEKEEIETRRHRIDRINSRKKKERMQARLLDVFGIEEALAAQSSALKLNEETAEQFAHEPQEKPSISIGSSKSSISNKSEDQLVQSDEAELREAEPEEKYKTAPVQMTEQDIYLHHLQTYFEDNMDEVFGDLEYCDDLSFLLHDPDEVVAEPLEDADHHECSTNGQGSVTFTFEVCITRENGDCHLDDCSDISLS